MRTLDILAAENGEHIRVLLYPLFLISSYISSRFAG